MTALEADPLVEVEPPERYPTPIGPPCEVRPGIARLTPYVRAGQQLREPKPKQRLFLMLRCREAFYGGAAGGGKSDALLMAALQFVDVPGYAALILRKTYADLTKAGALMPRAESWLQNTDARWSAKDKTWHFPAGSTVEFGYLQTDADVMNYRSAEYQGIFIDETTQHSEYAYRFLFSRLRGPDYPGEPSTMDGKTSLYDVPLRMRSGSNPGDIGHPWVKRRLVDPDTRVCPFIPSKLDDLAGIVNRDDYLRNLREMDPVNWMRYAHGDWEVKDPGEIFDVARMTPVTEPFPNDRRRYARVRYWDMAATEDPAKQRKKSGNPDWTVGAKVAIDKETGRWCIEHIARTRAEPDKVEEFMQQTAAIDGTTTDIVIEQEPGSEGKLFISYMRRHVLRGYHVEGDRPTGPKPSRIRMLQPIVNGGDCTYVLGPWNQAFLDEVDAWPNVEHDDQLDAFAGAHRRLTNPKGRVLV